MLESSTRDPKSDYVLSSVRADVRQRCEIVSASGVQIKLAPKEQSARKMLSGTGNRLIFPRFLVDHPFRNHDYRHQAQESN